MTTAFYQANINEGNECSMIQAIVVRGQSGLEIIYTGSKDLGKILKDALVCPVETNEFLNVSEMQDHYGAPHEANLRYVNGKEVAVVCTACKEQHPVLEMHVFGSSKGNFCRPCRDQILPAY